MIRMATQTKSTQLLLASIGFLLFTRGVFSIHDQMASKKLLACDFEVFGIVQGVFFRKYTEKQAKSLGVRGWCMNTNDGTVKGQLEGTQDKMNEMQLWLKTKGSPTSRVDKAVFSEVKEIKDYNFSDFVIKH